MKIGIDLGTANVLVFVQGQGITVREPSVVAIDADDRIVAVGTEAKEMVGRTPGSITAIRPLRDGVIADYVVTEAMLRYFIKKGTAGKISFGRPDVLVSVPAGSTSVEKRYVLDAARQAGAGKAYLIEEPMAAAIGAQLPISGPSGNMIVNIGGGTAEIAVISLSDIVVAKSHRVGGNRFDEAIALYIRRKYNLMIGDRTAEQVKLEIGSALPLEEELTMSVKGRDMIAGLPREVISPQRRSRRRWKYRYETSPTPSAACSSRRHQSSARTSLTRGSSSPAVGRCYATLTASSPTSLALPPMWHQIR
jgi:rod shape-determining protein MreB